MKIIAVTEKVPFTLQKKNELRSLTLPELKEMLTQPQINKASALIPILDREKMIKNIKDVEVKHNQVSSLLLRDVKDVIFLVNWVD